MTDKTAKGDGGASQVDAQVDKENEQGFRGVKVDQTPNENYSVAGVLAGKPTPETTGKGGQLQHADTTSTRGKTQAENRAD